MSLSDYAVVRKIGQGSFGEVFLYRHSEDDRQCVVKKMVVTDDELRRSAESEVRLLRDISHPNVVSYSGSFSDSAAIYLVMEYCDSGDLADRIQNCIKQGRGFPEKQIIDWTLDLCLALKHIHDRNILHRDLKPLNIFLTRGDVIKIGDLGIARTLNPGEFASTLTGTPLYVSPEVVHGKPYDNKVDVWSLGCCIYEMMSLEPAVNAQLLIQLGRRYVDFSRISVSSSNKQLVQLTRDMLSTEANKRPNIKKVLDSNIMKKALANRVSPPTSPTARKADDAVLPANTVAESPPPSPRSSPPAAAAQLPHPAKLPSPPISLEATLKPAKVDPPSSARHRLPSSQPSTPIFVYSSPSTALPATAPRPASEAAAAAAPPTAADSASDDSMVAMLKVGSRVLARTLVLVATAVLLWTLLHSLLSAKYLLLAGAGLLAVGSWSLGHQYSALKALDIAALSSSCKQLIDRSSYHFRSFIADVIELARLLCELGPWEVDGTSRAAVAAAGGLCLTSASVVSLVVVWFILPLIVPSWTTSLVTVVALAVFTGIVTYVKRAMNEHVVATSNHVAVDAAATEQTEETEA